MLDLAFYTEFLALLQTRPKESKPVNRHAAESTNGHSSNGTGRKSREKSTGKNAEHNGDAAELPVDPDPADLPTDEEAASASPSPQPPTPNPQPRRRRATAQTMAAAQRDISVSEFFAKNRHLLGFDNPRKALLTTVKEAVDNSLDACEEAGILPEIWVHIQPSGNNRFKIGVQDNGPGILKKQIPLIFGKLLYGSKFHRLRMSRGQQGIGISAAGMYGVLTTGKPVKIISKVSPRTPAHYYEIQIDTKVNKPEILNGRGDGVDIPPGEKGAKYIAEHGIEWIAVNDRKEETTHGTRVTIELEGRFIRGRGSVDEYLEQTAISNPHVRLHYFDPENQSRTFERSTDHLPPEPKEIKPHPYGVELGRLMTMLKDAKASTMSQFLTSSFSRVSPAVARKICEAAKISPRANTVKIGRHEADAIFQAIQANADFAAGDRLHFADRRGAIAQRIASGCAGRILRRGDASAVGLSRQPIRDRGGIGVRRVAGDAARRPRYAPRIARRKAMPVRCGNFLPTRSPASALPAPIEFWKKRNRPRGNRPASSKSRKSPHCTPRCTTSISTKGRR